MTHQIFLAMYAQLPHRDLKEVEKPRLTMEQSNVHNDLASNVPHSVDYGSKNAQHLVKCFKNIIVHV